MRFELTIDWGTRWRGSQYVRSFRLGCSVLCCKLNNHAACLRCMPPPVGCSGCNSFAILHWQPLPTRRLHFLKVSIYVAIRHDQTLITFWKVKLHCDIHTKQIACSWSCPRTIIVLREVSKMKSRIHSTAKHTRAHADADA